MPSSKEGILFFGRETVPRIEKVLLESQEAGQV
jgi:hypothetical protein